MTVPDRIDVDAPAQAGGPDASGVHPARTETPGTQGDAEPERRESGIAPAPAGRERMVSEITLTARGDELVQLALAESTRTEANLNLLLRGLQHLTAGATAALEANTQMACELDAVRDLLGRSQIEEHGLRQRVRLLERSLENLRRETARERAFFIEQEDLFLVELLADHEKELAELRERLERATAARVDARATIRPEPPEATQLGAVALRTIRIPRPTPVPAPDTLAPRAPATPPAGTPATQVANPNERDTVPPSSATLSDTESPAAATPLAVGGTAATPDEALLLTRPTSRPPLLQKPDLSTRPLVGYSLGSGDVAEEHLEGARLSPRKPEG